MPVNQNRTAIGAAGYSLIELLIVLAVIGIIAGIGYPNYAKYITETRRTDGHLALMNAVQFLERCRSTSYSYEHCVLPAVMTESDEGHYAITLVSQVATYTLTATAQSAQANDLDCPTMSIDDKSNKQFSGTGPCW